MGATFAIAARDFKAFFASPKGAAIFFFFLFVMGLFFISFVYTFEEMAQKAPMMGGQAPTLEQLLKALFYNLHFIMVLVIPAITMASFAEERKTGAIKLLQTAPVSALQIVAGKFAAAAGLIGLVLLASLVFPGYLIYFGNPDIGIIATSYLGLFLLMCSQIAFGMWVSSMTQNQFMAFMFTMLGMFLLLILNWIAPNITSSGWTESTVRWIASTDHLDMFFKGMITVADTVYFLVFIATFLFFTNVVLDSQRWR